MQRLAESPLARHVRCITINTEMLPQFAGSRSWLDEVRDTLLHTLQREDVPENWWDDDLDEEDTRDKVQFEYSRQRLRAGKDEFYMLAADQQRCSAIMCQILAEALSMYQNVQRLELIDNRGVPEKDEYYKRRFDGPVAVCSPWKGMLVDPEWYYRHLESKWHGEDREPISANVSSAYALHYIADALALQPGQRQLQPPASLKELTMTIGHHVPVTEILKSPSHGACRICPNYFPSGHESMYGMFNKLTRVNLRMRDDQFHHGRGVCREIAIALSCASTLKHLELDNRGVECPYFYEEIATLNVKRPWPVLKHLRLSGTIVTKQLMQILNLCCDSLRELEIEDVILVKPDCSGARWDDFFEAMQPSLSLERANIRHLHDEARRFEGVLFPRGGAKSAVNVAVESFLTKRVAELPQFEGWGFLPGARIPADWSKPDWRLE